MALCTARTSRWGGRSVMRAAQAAVPLPESAMLDSSWSGTQGAVSCATVCQHPLLHLNPSSMYES